jgi:GST-like protein
MNDLSAFPITKKWPAQHPDRLQLYSLPTPNGVKVSIMLEETGLPYEPHLVSFDTNDQMTPEFLSLNPNNKIPAILDPNGPGGKPFPLFESGAILIYLADKAGRFLPPDPAGRYETIQWLMFQMGGVGPMFGQVGFFHKFAGKDYEDKRPRDRYAAEAKRLLGVLNGRLADRAWIMGDSYTIADMAGRSRGHHGISACHARTAVFRGASGRDQRHRYPEESQVRQRARARPSGVGGRPSGPANVCAAAAV